MRPVIRSKLTTRSGQLAALTALAEDPKFKLSGYKDASATYRMQCSVCNTRHALNDLCGYCWGRVRMIREGIPIADFAGLQPAPLRIYPAPQLTSTHGDR